MTTKYIRIDRQSLASNGEVIESAELVWTPDDWLGGTLMADSVLQVSVEWRDGETWVYSRKKENAT